MIMRILACGSMAFCGAIFTGLLISGPLFSGRLSPSAPRLRSTAKESVPLGVELRRARDMLHRLVPEIHAKIRLIAHEEVEVAALQKQLANNERRLSFDTRKLQELREAVDLQPVLGGSLRANQLRRLGRSFEQLKQSEAIISSQRELLRVRQAALEAASDVLEDHRSEWVLLEQKIESLAARHRLLTARRAQATLAVESGELNRIAAILTEVAQQLEVTHRMLNFESRTLPDQTIPLVDESDLLTDVDRHLSS